MEVGSHGSTYGNNPLAMRVGNAVLDIILADGFLDHVKEVSHYLMEQLNQLTQSNYPENTPSLIEEVRGIGLMIGVKVTCDSKVFVDKLREQGLLTAPAADNIVRLLPPLTITKEDVDEAIKIIKSVNKQD